VANPGAALRWACPAFVDTVTRLLPLDVVLTPTLVRRLRNSSGLLSLLGERPRGQVSQ
jgi:hypothetical protein